MSHGHSNKHDVPLHQQVVCFFPDHKISLCYSVGNCVFKEQSPSVWCQSTHKMRFSELLLRQPCWAWLKICVVHCDLCTIGYMMSDAHTQRTIVPKRWQPLEEGWLPLYKFYSCKIHFRTTKAHRLPERANKTIKSKNYAFCMSLLTSCLPYHWLKSLQNCKF